MKIERLAGIPGKPGRWDGPDGGYLYVQMGAGKDPSIYGPIRKTKRDAIRAWNAMVRRIRKENAGGV
jgi:hypothetical protein